jgi:hypothetical protein
LIWPKKKTHKLCFFLAQNYTSICVSNNYKKKTRKIKNPKSKKKNPNSKHIPYTAAARTHLAKLIAKKIPNQNLSSSTNKNTIRPKKKKRELKKKLKPTAL